MKLSLALDLGTTSIAAIAVDLDGRIVCSVQSPNTARVPDLPAGHAEQDPEEICRIVVEVLSELARDLPGTPAGLGLTGQMHGMLLRDEARRPLTGLITWQDRRANEVSQVSADQGTGSGSSWLERFLLACPETDLAATGARPAAGYMGVTLAMLIAKGRVPETTSGATFLADWVAAEMTDSSIVTDRSNAAASGVYDLVEDRWSSSLLAAAEIPADWMPEVVPSGSVIGGLDPGWADRTGLPAGLPVCCAIGDNQAAVLGSLPLGEPAIQINVGTGGQINWPIDTFQHQDDMDTRYLPHDRFMLVGAGLAGGDAYAWVNRAVAGWLGAFGDEPAAHEIYSRLAACAATVPADADGLVCEPLFRGTRRHHAARGRFEGITFENFTPGHVARAVLTGIADGFAWFFENAGAARPSDCQRIVGSGNGLRQNPLLIESLQRRFGLPVVLAEHDQEAAFGTALLCGSVCGVWPDLATAGETIRLVG
jgi:sugar (pentulose or hexulose) kinase